MSSEESEIWRAFKASSVEKKKNNLSWSMDFLRENGIEMIQKPNHQYMYKGYSFYPTTGVYYHPIKKVKGRGVRNFLNHLKNNNLI